MKLVAYKSLSEYAKAKTDSKGTPYAFRVFYAPEQPAEQVPCPFDPDHPKGNCIQCATIHIVTESKTGRIHGDISSGTANKKSESACLESLPEKDRGLPEHYTIAPQAATCADCIKLVTPDFDFTIPDLTEDVVEEIEEVEETVDEELAETIEETGDAALDAMENPDPEDDED